MDNTVTFLGELVLIIVSTISVILNFISSKELAKTNSRISILQTQFLSLHSKRCEIIAELYKRLVKLRSATKEYTVFGHIIYEGPNGEELWKQRTEKAVTCYNEYQSYFFENKLYFTEDLAAILEKIARDYQSNLNDFEAYKFQKQFDADDKYELREARKTEQAAREVILNEIPKAIDAIEIEFKAILGVEETK